jgi:hypothetical protein
MEKSLFEQMGGTYRKSGDYYLPNLALRYFVWVIAMV